MKRKSKGRKQKKRDETPKAEMLERGHNTATQENENVVKRKRGRPKKCVITDNINDDDDDVFCEPHKPKRKLYNRESKSKGRVFIKAVTGKNKNVKKGKKRDLEKELNDIDVLIENMGTTKMTIVGDSNVEQCNLQVASTNQMDNANDKELWRHNSEQIKEESTHDGDTEHDKKISEKEATADIVTDGIVTYASVFKETEDKEITDGMVTDGNVSKESEDKEITDGMVTDGNVSKETEDKEITDGTATDMVGSKEDGDKTEQGTEREQHTEEVSHKNVDVQLVKVTETNATEEIRESTDTDSSDTEPITERDDDIDSTDSTNNTEEAISVDEDFSKVCSTCPSNPESESSSSSNNEEESVAENNKAEIKEKTEAQKKRRKLRTKIQRKSKKQIDYNEETDGSDQMGSNKKSETCESETEEETKRVDIKYAT